MVVQTPPTKPTRNGASSRITFGPHAGRFGVSLPRPMSEDEFFDFCQANEFLRIERTHEGEIIMMAPAGGESGNQSGETFGQLREWARRDGNGVAFDASAGFVLPNGAMRAPDAAWVRRERLAALTAEQKRKFLPLCPDFVIEVRSPTDRIAKLKEKMAEYLANGAQLGWLIEPDQRRVHVYSPSSRIEIFKNPQCISGDPFLPGFTLDLQPIWEPGW